MKEVRRGGKTTQMLGGERGGYVPPTLLSRGMGGGGGWL